MVLPKFTSEQIEWFKRYVQVQRSNRFNMLTPAAAQAADLTHEQHLFVIENYDELRIAAQRS